MVSKNSCEPVDDDKYSSASGEENMVDEEIVDSDSESDTAFSSLSDVSPNEKNFNGDFRSVDDGVQVTDTDSFVLVWNCENDLFPQMKLYHYYETRVIQFSPANGDLLAGGGRGGQLVVWNMGDNFEKRPRKSRLENDDVIRKFMENLPGWPVDDEKYPTLRPVAISDRDNSHFFPVTCLEWLHPSLQVSSSGVLTMTEKKSTSQQIFTSSNDGCIKIWDFKRRQLSQDELDRINGDDDTHGWTLELLYNMLVPNQYEEKYWVPICSFKIFAPSIKYNRSARQECYEFAPELNSKCDRVIVMTNKIAEVGVIRWNTVEPDESVPKKAEKCQHEWWGICHGDAITSLSQNFYFPKIMLTVGGQEFALWNVEFKRGPIWWHQYPWTVTISHGCFTPFHPGLIYVTRSDGYLDIWNITKQIHKPVAEIFVSGFSILALSVVTPPCPNYQIGIADSNGNFHILKNHFDTNWSENDILIVGQFFERAKENCRQRLHFNRTWKEQTTFTDEYGFERKPRKKKFQMGTKRTEKDEKKDETKLENDVKYDDFPTASNVLEKIVKSEKYQTELAAVLQKINSLREENFEEKCAEVMARLRSVELDDLSANEIIEKYLS